MPSTLDQSHCLQAASHLLKLLDAAGSTICWLLHDVGQNLDKNNEQQLLVVIVKCEAEPCRSGPVAALTALEASGTAIGANLPQKSYVARNRLALSPLAFDR